METSKDKEHLLALKVMRLTKPTLMMAPPSLNCDLTDLPKDSFLQNNKLDSDVIPRFCDVSLGECLTLPQNFGNIFLGEIFSSYISINNDSDQTCLDVTVKTELQTSSQRVTLSKSGNSARSALEPSSSIDEIVQHEVKELGTHILVCTVSYSLPVGERMNFRKFFKFHVLKPLDVKTKFYNTDTDEVYLEAQIQNQTQGPIYLEKVTLEPCPPYCIETLSSLPSPSHKQTTTNRSLNYLNAQDTRQYLYRLTTMKSSPHVVDPTLQQIASSNTTIPSAVSFSQLSSPASQSPNLSPHHPQVNKGISNIGKLDIVYKSSMGEKGRLQTSQLQKVTHGSGDIKVTVVKAPGEVKVGYEYPIVVCVTNCCERSMDLIMSLHNDNKLGFAWTGISGYQVGKLESGSSKDLYLSIIVTLSGLVSVSGLHITDQFLKRTYEHDDIFQVFAYDSTDDVQCF